MDRPLEALKRSMLYDDSPIVDCAIVRESQVAIVEHFGKFNRIIGPGFHFIGVCGLCRARRPRLSLRLQERTFRCETKSKNNVFVALCVSVQFQVKKGNIYEAFYSLQDAEAQLQAFVYASIRASIPLLELDDVFEQQKSISDSVQADVSDQMAAYGYEIVDVLLVDISPNKLVAESMNMVNTSKRNRLARKEIAEARKMQIIKSAEASSTANKLLGEGVSRQRKAIVDGIQESVTHFKDDKTYAMNAKETMDLIVMTEYLDTVKEIASMEGSKCVFFTEENNSNNSFMEEARNILMQAASK